MGDETDKVLEANSAYRSALRQGGKSKEIAATKEFAISATGNLFLATTLNGGDAGGTDISDEAKTAFGQVSVFFAAMTKAMAEADNEASVYDYDTINKIVSKSAMFVKVTDSKVNFTSNAWGVHFGEELVESLFGLTGGLSTIAKSLTEMIIGIGKKANGIKINSQGQKSTKQVGTIIFVCEYLLGAVSITPIVFNVDVEDASKAFQAGPCFSMKKETQSIKIVKQVYSFVPPEFIKEAATLNDAIEDKELNKLVNILRGYISDDNPAE